ncbi:MAG: hypothetical protein QOH05_3407 [Acetobacteraceae bacterium]|nr:hypothetical protein [Acetobacteraceae bacterium]
MAPPPPTTAWLPQSGWPPPWVPPSAQEPGRQTAGHQTAGRQAADNPDGYSPRNETPAVDAPPHAPSNEPTSDSSRPVYAPAPVAAPKPSPVAAVAKSGIDLGGVPVGAKTSSLFDEAGGTRTSSIWPGFVSYAFAAAAPSRLCTQDPAGKDRDTAPATGRSAGDYNTADFLPGLNNVPWGGVVNGTFVALTGVAVLRAHAAPVGDVTIEFYPHWDAVRDKASAKPAVSLPATVRAYEAQNGFLLRALVRAPASPVACLDILIPYTGFHATKGRIHYTRGGAEYAAAFTPARLRQ